MPDVDTGSGIFGVGQDTDVDLLRREREAQYGTINGSTITAGRWLADAVAEPGTKPYTILSGLTDASVDLAGDPLNALGGIGAARQARRAFLTPGDNVVTATGRATDGAVEARRATLRLDQITEEMTDLARHGDTASMDRWHRLDLEADEIEHVLARTPDEAGFMAATQSGTDVARTAVRAVRPSADEGLRDVGREAAEALRRAGGVQGTRRTVDPARVEAWLVGEEGGRVLDVLADTTDARGVWDTLGRTIDPDLAVRIADAPSPTAVADVLRPELGLTIRNAPLSSARDVMRMRRRAPEYRGIRRSRWRMAGKVPSSHINVADPLDSVEQLDRYLRNVDFDEADRSDWFRRMAEAGGLQERKDVLFDAVAEVERRLIGEHGMDADRAHDLTRLFGDSQETVRMYFVDQAGGEPLADYDDRRQR